MKYSTPELQNAVDGIKRDLIERGVEVPLVTDVAPLLPEPLRAQFWQDAVEGRLAELEREMLGVIVDHDDVPARRGPWVTGWCASCGERTDAHLSYGKNIAEHLGGAPLDYVRRLPEATP